MNDPPSLIVTQDDTSRRCQEDCFITILGFKACIMGWRVVRLMTLSIDHTVRVGSFPVKPSIFASPAQIVLARLMEVTCSEMPSTECEVARPGQSPKAKNSYDSRYLEWTSKTFALRNTWPGGAWMVAVFEESRRELT